MEEILSQIGQLSPYLILGLGLSVGLQHAFEPDHISAIGTQIFKNKLSHKSKSKAIKYGTLRSSILGASWGAGHTTTLVMMGLLMYVLAIKIEQNVFSSFEIIVGIMLIFLAITTLINKKIVFYHKHPHQHTDGTIHYDSHEHIDSDHIHGHKSYLIGCVHGLAGSGSLVVFAISTMQNTGMLFGFILVFGIGSMIGMTLVSTIMGLPFALSNKTIISKITRYVSGILSFIVGLNIIVQNSTSVNLLGF